MRLPLAALPLASIAALAGCGSGGGPPLPSSPLPSSVSLRQGPVEAEIVYRSDVVRGRLSTLEVRAPIHASVALPCSAGVAELTSVDAARIAYRCAPGETWRLVYVGASRLFDRCTPTLGTAEAPDFASAPATVVEAAGAIAACMPADSASWADQVYFPELLDEAAQRGTATLARVLLDTLAHEGARGWSEHAARVPASELGWHEGLVAALAEAPPSPIRSCRAAFALGVDDPVVTARTPALIPSFLDGVCGGPDTVRLFEGLHRHAPEAATALACGALQDAHEGDPGGWTLAPLHHLASTPDARCDLRAWVASLRCRPAMRCDDHLCRGAELELDLASPQTMDAYRALLVVETRNGALPEAWSRLESCGEWSPE